MKQKQLAELTDEELLQEAKKMRSAAIINAAFIGFLAGVAVYSIAHNTFGFLVLILLLLAFWLVKTASYPNKELDRLLKERNLK